MGNLTLNGATSGQITISPPAVAGTNTLTLPASTGTVALTASPTFTGTTTVSNLAMNGSSSGTTTLSPSATASGTVTIPAGTGTAAVQGVSTNLVSGTSVPTTSGTSIVIATGIPAYVKRITIIFNGVNLNGTSDTLVQLGTGAGPTYTTTGYVSASGRYSYTNSTGGTNSTAGLNIASGNATANLLGSMTIHNITGNTWVGNHVFGATGSSNVLNGGGSIALAAPLTAIRIASANGSDAYAAGSINILYE